MPRKKKTETEEQVEEEKEETSKDSPDVGFSIDVFSDSHLGKEEKKESFLHNVLSFLRQKSL